MPLLVHATDAFPFFPAVPFDSAPNARSTPWLSGGAQWSLMNARTGATRNGRSDAGTEAIARGSSAMSGDDVPPSPACGLSVALPAPRLLENAVCMASTRFTLQRRCTGRRFAMVRRLFVGVSERD
jgi:hypothetical protein